MPCSIGHPVVGHQWCCRAWADHICEAASAVALDKPLTANGAACLLQIPHLQHLTTTAVVNTHFISRLTRLTSVALKAQGSLATTDLFALQALPQLQLLELHNIAIQSFGPLIALTQLRHLVTAGCSFAVCITDAYNQQASRLPRLDLCPEQAPYDHKYCWPAIPLPHFSTVPSLATLLLGVRRADFAGD